MGRKTNLALIATCVAFIAGALSGCSDGDDDSSTEAEARSAAQPNFEGRRLVVWTHEFAPFNEAIRDVWIPQFAELHPEVDVEYEFVPFSGTLITYNTKVLAALASGAGPDTWDIGSWNFTEDKYIDAGLVAPLDPTVFGYDSVDAMVDAYPPNSLNAFRNEENLYAVFNELTTFCLFYNRDVFDDAGVPYLPEDRPISWDRVLEIADQVLVVHPESSDIERIGYQFGFFAQYHSPQWYSQMFYPFLRQFGQDDFYIDGEPAADTDAMIAALRMFYDFTHVHRAYDPYYYEDWFSGFAEGRVAMLAAGPWFVSAIRGVNPDANIGIAPLPVVDPDDPTTYRNIMYSFGWAVNPNRSEEQQHLAQEFLRFMLGGRGEWEQAAWWFENVGLLQPKRAFIESPGYQSILRREPWLACFDRTYETYHVDYYQHSSDEAGSALIRAIDRVVYNASSPEESARLLQNELILLPDEN